MTKKENFTEAILSLWAKMYLFETTLLLLSNIDLKYLYQQHHESWRGRRTFFFPLFWMNMEKKFKGRMLYILNIQCDVLSH